jgi:hypothetical protein
MQCTRLEKAPLVANASQHKHGCAVPQMAIYSIATAWSLVALANSGFAA